MWQQRQGKVPKEPEPEPQGQNFQKQKPENTSSTIASKQMASNEDRPGCNAGSMLVYEYVRTCTR